MHLREAKDKDMDANMQICARAGENFEKKSHKSCASKDRGNITIVKSIKQFPAPSFFSSVMKFVLLYARNLSLKESLVKWNLYTVVTVLVRITSSSTDTHIILKYYTLLITLVN